MQDEKRWLTITEASRYIGMSTGFLRKCVRFHRVPHTRIGAKALRFDKTALDDWLAAQSNGENCFIEDGEGR